MNIYNLEHLKFFLAMALLPLSGSLTFWYLYKRGYGMTGLLKGSSYVGSKKATKAQKENILWWFWICNIFALGWIVFGGVFISQF